MVRSPFTGIVSALVGLVGTVNYYFDLINSEVLIGGERELQSATVRFVSLERYLKIWNTEEICGQFGSFDGSSSAYRATRGNSMM